MEQTNHLLMTSMGSADIDRYSILCSIASFAYFAEKFIRISNKFGFFTVFDREIAQALAVLRVAVILVILY